MGRKKEGYGTSQQAGEKSDSVLNTVVERNVRALLVRRQREEKEKGIQERIADAITRFAGSMPFVYVHLFVFGIWIAANLGVLPHIPRFDPSFVVLAMFASVEAIFLSTFVLITQNRMAALADKRADLDLQVSLLAEHELTRLIQLVTKVAEKTGIDTSIESELDQISQDVRPEEVLNTMEAQDKNPPGD